MKKFLSLVCMTAMLSTSAGVLNAQEADDYGVAYESSTKAPSISPTLVLGTVAVAAIIAVAVQNRSSGHHHHSH